MGGAIQNQGTSESTLTIGSKAYFEGNSSKHSYGGAIANYAHKGTDAGIIVTNIGADAQFIGNSAALGGGAIFNNGTLNFEATPPSPAIQLVVCLTTSTTKASSMSRPVRLPLTAALPVRVLWSSLMTPD